jgi:aryl-alcohol dehydrogenase-like predicted oxidoreductase
MTFPTRAIGPFAVPPIGLGCMNLSHAYPALPSEADGIALLRHALDAGCTFFDTAAIYGTGANEQLVAKAIGNRRQEFTLASKCVLDLVDGERVLNGRPEVIKGTCERALKRLNTDVIDLYYLHRLDKTVPIEDSVGAMAELVAEGKIRTVGLSEMSAATIRRAHAVHPITALQTEYSPAVRNPEVAVLDLCDELDITFVAFSPVMRGLLAGAIADDGYAAGDIRAAMPRFTGDRLATNLALVARYNAIAAEAGITPAQLSLAWVLAQRPTLVTIPGTRSIAHFDENMAAIGITLDADTLAKVDALLPANALSGARYPAAMQAQIDTELLPDEELA